MSNNVEDFGSQLAKDDENKSSSSGSEIDDYIMLHNANKNRLFGRQKPLHLVLGGGKSADVLLWRNKRTSGCIFAGVTTIWFLFACAGYHLLSFLCHALILSLTTLFLWSNLASFLNVPPPDFPTVVVPEHVFVNLLLAVRSGLNQGVIIFRDVASGKDLKRFLSVIVSLWIISVVGSWFTFLSLFYLVFLMVLTGPMLYEKHEDHVDAYAEKAWIEIKKQYAVLDEKYLHKLPILAALKDQILKQH
ncbi:hypothetical protein Tsubulata_025327 [Turnera subulata]|uniref:Reticulon-like protein n=1 Tax=Turnera subulata TaxID=218843 RepID=A0A9Q0J6E4_9ROSI|nr:hypothetical protein Tsubulata_025327 [Turnera subulata]